MKRRNIEKLLPEVFRRTSQPETTLFTLLEVMEAFHEPAEEILQRLPTYFSPHAAPDPLVPLLATWVDLDWLWQVDGGASITRPMEAADQIQTLSCGLGRVRDLVRSAAFLSKWRGTSRGLVAFLGLATGIRGIQVDERVVGPNGRPMPFHIRILIPGKERHRGLIERIVKEEKPAYVTFDLKFEAQEG